MRQNLSIALRIIGWASIAVFLGLVFWDIFVLDQSLSKGQMLLKYWPVLAVGVVAGVAGDMLKEKAQSDAASDDKPDSVSTDA